MNITKIHRDLPLFLIRKNNKSLIYLPGYVCNLSHSDGEDIKTFFACSSVNISERIKKLAFKLKEYGMNIQRKWKEKLSSPFEPLCLTLYLSNDCNLDCTYCYTGKVSKKPFYIDENSVTVAAKFVADFCRKKNHPFLFILHGGGEPSVHWDQVVRLEAITRKIAENFNVEWSGTIITNGVISEEKARWLAGRFNHIVLSCDGPPFIQNRLRPLKNGTPSSSYIEHTAGLINSLNGSFSIRSTITPDTVEYQSHIVTYLHEKLSAVDIRFEPVYEVWDRDRSPFKRGDALRFAEHFLMARKKAEELGCNLSFSGARLDELHSTYCSMFRNVLHLVPPDGITGCFFCPDSSARPELITGGFYKGEIRINNELIDLYRNKSIKERCENCVNIYHCSRECPEVCFVTCEEETEGFRCLVQKELALKWIWEMAEDNNGNIYDSFQ